jgi:TonB family protein
VKQTRSSRPFPPIIAFLLPLALLVSLSAALQAQSPAADPDSAEAVQTRIERARALIAAHQLETAASELESVRGATQDDSVRNVTSVMLMSVYLEEGNYARAQALLEENFQSRSAKNEDSVRTYFALAGQAVNGARAHLARYRSFGINTTDSSLPIEALNDLDRLRSLLERMVAQAKEISKDRRAYDSLSLLEDVLGIRLSLAKDSEDQTKWASEYASVREVLASSQMGVASLGGIPMLPQSKVPGAALPLTKATPETNSSEKKIVSPSSNQATESATQTPPKSETRNHAREQTQTQTPNYSLPDSGSLNAKATKRVVPRYPALAKQSGATGSVRVYVVVDENGKVVEVSHSEGPLLLRRAAEDAARQWSFGPSSDQRAPERYSGYIDFSFSL